MERKLLEVFRSRLSLSLSSSLSPSLNPGNTSLRSSGTPSLINGVLWRGIRRFCSATVEDISITDNCVIRLHEIIKEEGRDKMLRVSVEGGGCSGFQYVFALEDSSTVNDRIFEKNGAKVVVDDVSMGFLKGATVDYVEELIRASFMVTNNPNASGGCGCGSSFVAK
ncbi:hypothetical protein KP509_23G021600 [Ceratopteris richardii]|uniref:Core domain-containing protein n=1 Tax=Ceratopteris richardii TaxID=49495 RepID=A0A8T2S142_CERRI|nr:hypothetical protein KP509_23G021600 [Ceratopteris richardii]